MKKWYANVDYSILLSELQIMRLKYVQILSNYGQMARNEASGDSCLPGRIFTYLNRPEVQKALHTNQAIASHLPNDWNFCSTCATLLQFFNSFNIINFLAFSHQWIKETWFVQDTTVSE